MSDLPVQIPAQEFPHSNEYAHASGVLPEWWQFPKAVQSWVANKAKAPTQPAVPKGVAAAKTPTPFQGIK